MKALHMVAFVLVIIGGLNWGLTAFGWNVVNMIFGSMAAVEKIIYILVGLSAVYLIIDHKNSCKYCAKQSMPGQSNM